MDGTVLDYTSWEILHLTQWLFLAVRFPSSGVYRRPLPSIPSCVFMSLSTTSTYLEVCGVFDACGARAAFHIFTGT